MLKVHTAEISYMDPDELDVSVRSGDTAFAPTWDMVRLYKEGDLSEGAFTHIYEKLMEKSYQDHPDKWQALLGKERVVLKCYCRHGVFCHRVLLANILQARGAEYQGEI